METEKEWEIHEKLESIREQQEEYNLLQKKLEAMEEEAHWQNQQVKQTNDNIIDNYTQDPKLYKLLLEKEDMLREKTAMEKIFFEECRDNLHHARNRAEQEKESYEKELQTIQMKGEP